MTRIAWEDIPTPRDIKTLTDLELIREAEKCDAILRQPKSLKGAIEYLSLPYTDKALLEEAKRRGQERRLNIEEA